MCRNYNPEFDPDVWDDRYAELLIKWLDEDEANATADPEEKE